MASFIVGPYDRRKGALRYERGTLNARGAVAPAIGSRTRHKCSRTSKIKRLIWMALETQLSRLRDFKPLREHIIPEWPLRRG